MAEILEIFPGDKTNAVDAGNGVYRVIPPAEVDVVSVAEFSQTLQHTIGQESCEDIVIELGNVKFFGAAAIGAICEAFSAAKSKNKLFVIDNVGPNSHVAHKIFSHTGCDQTLFYIH